MIRAKILASLMLLLNMYILHCTSYMQDLSYKNFVRRTIFESNEKLISHQIWSDANKFAFDGFDQNLPPGGFLVHTSSHKWHFHCKNFWGNFQVNSRTSKLWHVPSIVLREIAKETVQLAINRAIVSWSIFLQYKTCDLLVKSKTYEVHLVKFTLTNYSAWTRCL